MASLATVSEELAEIDGQIADIFRALSRSRQLEELTDKLRECKRLIKEFDRELKGLEDRNDPDTNKMLNERKQSLVVHDTINVGTDTAAALKAQTEQMSGIINEMDAIHFSIKKASKLVKEIGRQVATDKCIMALLFLIVLGVVTIIIVKLVNPHNKDIRDIPGLAPPVQSRRLLWKC
ncbi:putative plant SNARE 11 [Camellia lanceoleosa]|nr:putative plant SNARE 11 [Camellia lanceoleosa]